MDDTAQGPTSFRMNRDRLLNGEIAQACFAASCDEVQRRRLMSDGALTVDATLVETWTSHKNFRPADEAPSAAAKVAIRIWISGVRSAATTLAE